MRNTLSVWALFGACLAWVIFFAGLLRAFFFVSCAAGPQTLLDNCQHAFLVSTVVGYCVAAVALLFSASGFLWGSRCTVIAAVVISGAYVVPITCLYLFLALLTYLGV